MSFMSDLSLSCCREEQPPLRCSCFFNDFLGHWWSFHMGNVLQSKGRKTHFIKPVQCCCLFKPTAFCVLFCFFYCLSQGQKTHCSLIVYSIISCIFIVGAEPNEKLGLWKASACRTLHILAWLQIRANESKPSQEISSPKPQILQGWNTFTVLPNWDKRVHKR